MRRRLPDSQPQHSTPRYTLRRPSLTRDPTKQLFGLLGWRPCRSALRGLYTSVLSILP